MHGRAPVRRTANYYYYRNNDNNNDDDDDDDNQQPTTNMEQVGRDVCLALAHHPLAHTHWTDRAVQSH